MEKCSDFKTPIFYSNLKRGKQESLILKLGDSERIKLFYRTQ